MSDRDRTGVTLARLLYGTSLKRTLVRSVLLGAGCLVLFKLLFIPVRVDGGSMLPTYAEKGINLVYRMAYRHGAPHRGDVVAIRTRTTSRSLVLMKRIVGLPGEAIGFKDGLVTVNGVVLDEPYVRFRSDWNQEPVVCGPKEYFVVGDNRSMPIEHHRHGRVKRNLIAGKMVL